MTDPTIVRARLRSAPQASTCRRLTRGSTPSSPMPHDTTKRSSTSSTPSSAKSSPRSNASVSPWASTSRTFLPWRKRSMTSTSSSNLPSTPSSFESSLPAASSRNAENVVILFGPPGVGKTHLAIALGRAIVESRTQRPLRARNRTPRRALPRRNRGETRRETTLLRQAEAPPHRRARLPTPSEKRSGSPVLPNSSRVATSVEACSTITTNQLVTQWGAVFPATKPSPPPSSTAYSHHSFTMVIQGESYRLKQKKKAGLVSSSHPQGRMMFTRAGGSELEAQRGQKLRAPDICRGGEPRRTGASFFCRGGEPRRTSASFFRCGAELSSREADPLGSSSNLQRETTPDTPGARKHLF